MARLHVLGDWHGPGEEKAARRLAESLPERWDVVAGRNVPSGMGTVDLDLVVVGERAVFVCEEKAWGKHVVTGEVSWYVNGSPRHSPTNQVAHAARVLAGRLKMKVAGWSNALGQLPKGVKPVFAHVVLSHDHLVLEDNADLGTHSVLRLDDVAPVLTALDAGFPASMAPLRQQLMTFLLGLPQRSAEMPPVQIMQYEVLAELPPQENARVYSARTPAGEQALLTCVPIEGVADPEQAHARATRDHDALVALSQRDRTWRVQSWFDWDGYRVTPVIVEERASLGRLAAAALPRHDSSGRVPLSQGVPVVRDAFAALADVHDLEITHRALQLRSIEVTPGGRVRFRDFGRAHLPSAATIAPALDEEHASAGFRPPGVPLAFHQPTDDVYSLALCLVQWLHGDASDLPDHDIARERAAAYPQVGDVLARCLSLDAGERLTAAQASTALVPTPGPGPREDRPTSEGTVVAGRYRLVRQLGEGAWATTWLAFDENLDEHRTLKFLRPERVSTEQVKAEFDNARLLRSYHCARVDDRLPHPEPGVLVQEYVRGQTLHDLVAGSRLLEREEARRIAVDVLNGLADAHGQSLYHRDVSPNNIIVRDDGRAVLIDFGLAAKADAAQSAVGSPPYTAPEVWARRQWSPAADIYSAAASVLQAMLGRLPYAGAGLDERRTLVPPSAEHVQRYGRALLDALYSAVAYEPGERPRDAAAFAQVVQRASDTVVAPGRRVVNPTVEALRGLYRDSSIGNAGNRGLDDAFARDTYAATRLDAELLPAIVAGRLDVVVLSGNPGDGKTSFLVRVGAALDEAGATSVHEDAAGWRKRLRGRTFAAVYDASESHGELSSDALIRQALDPGDGDDPAQRTVLLAANDGRIAQFCAEHRERYPEITAELDRQLRGGGSAASDARIVLVDLKRRALALPDLDGPALGANILSSLTALHRWEICKGCEAREVCPMRANAEQLRAGRARRAVSELLLTSHLRRRRRATVRDVRSAFAWLVTGDTSCDAVHDDVENGLDPAAGRRAFDLAFDAGSGDYLVREWAELDPAVLPAPGAARAARGRRDLVPDLASLDTTAMTGLKRSLYFGAWDGAGARPEVRSYRYLDDYLHALSDPGAALPRMLLGVSRVLAFVGYPDEGTLALRDRVFDDPAVRSIVVIKELPASEFELRAATAAAPFVESFPDQLELRHRSGARLRITLDTAELLFRSADGEVLGDSASAALRQEIEGFGNRLRLEPARRVRIVDGSGSSVVAEVAAGGTIVRRQS
ncbi:protein kinase [Pseudonocardia sp. DSM 110487]|uniref:protein kinase domain-containing protein n=1 Tax=Pseudonocardia sp. DSM 110487 TaxID=2865833 RepID=UPI001C6A685A|nr:protein kinase [Pseudonocardia sp. DSM 110487]QYN37775.1 protein kinase [Pseudonocardia sp. DSM 110487]